METTLKREQRYHVTALERGLSILDCFVQGPPELMLIEIAARLGLTKATAFRLVQTPALGSKGFLRVTVTQP